MKKKHIFKYKVKVAAYCCLFPEDVLVILLKANKIC